MAVRKLFAMAICLGWLLVCSVLSPETACGEWQEHQIRQGDGNGGWVSRPALRQVLRHPDANFTMPFGLVQMDNGEIALLCSREKTDAAGRTVQAVIAFSKDGGATWSKFATVPGTTDRPMLLTDLGKGRLSFLAPNRFFSNDYGRTWPENAANPPTQDGMPFNSEGNAWVDRDEQGRAKAILELGWHYAPGKSHPKDDATVVFRRSLDGGKNWIDEVAPPQWKFTVEHNGKKWLRGVSEGAIVRAANGDLVAALRSDMPPKYFDGPHDDSLEGTAVSISKDDGETWSEMQFLFDAGRHHANLQQLPNGDLVCTLVVRDDILTGKLDEGQLTSRRRGCDALISQDHGQTWNLDRRYELDRFDFLRADGYWVDGVCGHIGAVALPDGHVISAYGHYPLGAVLIKWKPDAEPALPVPKIGIQIGPQAGELERYAAGELSGYLQQLFHTTAKPAVHLPDSPDVLLLIGTPDTNPAVAKTVGKDGWPKVSDQGIVLKRVTVDGKLGLVIGGGSQAATLWAVYELAERWGVRFLLHGDVLPERPSALRLPQTDVVLEPNLRVRQWRTVNDFACGPESWGLDGPGPEFWNPDLPRGGSFQEFAAAGEKLIQGIFAHARSRGMQNAISATLTEFPPEFALLLKNSEKVHQLGSTGIVPGNKTSVDDADVSDLAAAVSHTTVNTYADVDYVLLGMPEHRQWAGEYERAWQSLDRKYHIGEKISLAAIIAAAERRTGYPGGAARAVQEVKGDIVLLYFYDRLLTEPKALEGTRRPDVKIILNSTAEELLTEERGMTLLFNP